MNKQQVEEFFVQKARGENVYGENDLVAVEEPLQVQLAYSTQSGRIRKNIAVTMRTPGNDEELAAGFLFTEGVIAGIKDISSIRPMAGNNHVLVELKEAVLPKLANMERNFYSSSSCGICGKASIEAIFTQPLQHIPVDQFRVPVSVLYGLQEKLKSAQKLFADTGGIHASALFNGSGELLLLREDVGRHNALDKLIGAVLLQRSIAAAEQILFLSGRASFELIQKAAMAGIRLVVAVGAPSSLAVELAREKKITLAGFLRSDRLNIYSEKERIIL